MDLTRGKEVKLYKDYFISYNNLNLLVYRVSKLKVAETTIEKGTTKQRQTEKEKYEYSKSR